MDEGLPDALVVTEADRKEVAPEAPHPGTLVEAARGDLLAYVLELSQVLDDLRGEDRRFKVRSIPNRQ